MTRADLTDLPIDRLNAIDAEVVRLQESTPNRIGKTWVEFNELRSLLRMARRGMPPATYKCGMCGFQCGEKECDYCECNGYTGRPTKEQP